MTKSIQKQKSGKTELRGWTNTRAEAAALTAVKRVVHHTPVKCAAGGFT